MQIKTMQTMEWLVMEHCFVNFLSIAIFIFYKSVGISNIEAIFCVYGNTFFSGSASSDLDRDVTGVTNKWKWTYE